MMGFPLWYAIFLVAIIPFMLGAARYTYRRDRKLGIGLAVIVILIGLLCVFDYRGTYLALAQGYLPFAMVVAYLFGFIGENCARFIGKLHKEV